jgi:hypothetical protein
MPPEVKVEFALPPSVVMAAMHTTMISANMTAYSTAVGPSSRLMKFTTFFSMTISKIPKNRGESSVIDQGRAACWARIELILSLIAAGLAFTIPRIPNLPNMTTMGLVFFVVKLNRTSYVRFNAFLIELDSSRPDR